MEHHDVLFLLGSEALVELVAVAVVEDIIALNAVFFGEIVLELIICVVKHAVAVKIEPYGAAALESQRKQAVIHYPRILQAEIEHIVKRHEQFIKCIVESRRRRNSKHSVLLFIASIISEEYFLSLILSQRNMGAEIIRELVSIAAGLNLELEPLCLCDIDIKAYAPECGSLYPCAVIFIVRVSQFNLLARAVFYYKHARLFDIVKYDALQKCVHVQSFAEHFERVDDYRHLVGTVNLLAVIEHAQILFVRCDTHLVAALYPEQKMLVIKIHIRVVENDAVVDSVKQGIYPADCSVELIFRIAVGQQDILRALPVYIIDIERLEIRRHMTFVSAEHLLPHSHGVFKDIIGVAFFARCAAGAAQIEILRAAAEADFEFVTENIEAVFLILMECERGIEKNILPLAEILDADVHRRLRYIAIFGILEVIDARLFEELVSVVQGELLLAVIRNYLVGHKIDLVKMPVEEIGDRLERIVGECIVGVEIGYILTLRVLDTEISRCRNAAVFEREHLEDIIFFGIFLAYAETAVL